MDVKNINVAEEELKKVSGGVSGEELLNDQPDDSDMTYGPTKR